MSVYSKQTWMKTTKITQMKARGDCLVISHKDTSVQTPEVGLHIYNIHGVKLCEKALPNSPADGPLTGEPSEMLEISPEGQILLGNAATGSITMITKHGKEDKSLDIGIADICIGTPTTSGQIPIFIKHKSRILMCTPDGRRVAGFNVDVPSVEDGSGIGNGRSMCQNITTNERDEIVFLLQNQDGACLCRTYSAEGVQVSNFIITDVDGPWRLPLTPRSACCDSNTNILVLLKSTITGQLFLYMTSSDGASREMLKLPSSDGEQFSGD
jgi:hypothetical protein